MSLSQALASAMSGLRANQIALGLVSSNVANAETPGYIKKTSNQVAVSSGEFGSSVRVAGINRELDMYLQRQLRTEIAGAVFAGLQSRSSRSAAIDLRHAGIGRNAGKRLQRADQLGAGAVDEFGLAVGAHCRRQCGAVAGAAAQHA